MDGRLLGAASCAAVLLAAGGANAQSGTQNYYTPPKIATQGKNSSAVAGAGIVVVKVLVKSDASASVQGIIRSSNHGDDAAALEIAKSATYAAATRGGKKLTAFYDYTLKFTSSGSSSTGDSGGGATGAGLAQFEREIRAGNYSGAQSGLKAYLAKNPADRKAQLELGVASTYLNDDEGAAAAFDKAGTIPDNYKALAAKAYADLAAQSLKNKDNAAAVAAAKRSVAIAPGIYTYNTLGTAEDAAGDPTAAIADFERSRSLATSAANVKPADRAQIDVNLMSAYLDAGKPDLAKQMGAEAARLDPASTGSQTVLANFYSKQATDASSAGKFGDAGGLYEQAAAAAPSQAVSLYSSAALAYLKAKPNPDNDKAKAAADKALAIEPDNAVANFAAGISLANQSGKSKDALVFLNKADASAKKAGDASLTAAVESAIKQLGGTK